MSFLVRLLAGLALVCASSAALSQESEGERDRIVFSVISTEQTEAVEALWQPFVDAMEETTGLEVELVSAIDYAGVIEAMRFGQVDVGWFSNLSGLQAIRLADAEVFAKTLYPGGQEGYRSVILVRDESPIRTLDDLLTCDGSLSFALGDPNSTSGTLVPLAYIFAPRGIDPQSCFSQVTNANHEQTALAVVNGFVDAGTNNTTNLDRLAQTRPEALEDLRILWTSPLIQTDPIVWRRDLPEEVKAEVLSFFLTYGFRGDAEQRAYEQAVLDDLFLGGFLPATDEHLLPIRRLELMRDLAEAQASDALEEAEREIRLEQVQTAMRELAAEERRVAVRELSEELIAARARMGTEADAATADINALVSDFLAAQPRIQVERRVQRVTASEMTRGFIALAAGLGLFALLMFRSRPPRFGPSRLMSDRLIDAAIWSGLFGLLIWSFWPAEMFKLPLLGTNAPRMGEYIAGFFQLDLDGWETYARQTLVTVQIALWGTVVAVIAAIPFGLLASRNIAPVWIVQPVRRLMDAFRAINELVVAAIFVAAVGLGPFAGVMALALHTTGVLAKLFSEAVEAIDDGPVEGVRATGAGPLNEVVWGVIPQVIPLWASYALYRFESNTRAATILGLIGAGGIGQLLIQNIRSFEYGKTATILLIIIAAVTAVDLISQMLRKRLV
ncbi:MAG: phosphonate ABC transporter, permease protein PhnE [Caulobacterales bacterium]|uniref:phosphonate ABC transporter, permease protein PhnE n=1 Tax=Glycocaulis sp. TaxID=1969725 RepID=UPI003F9F8CE3